MVNESPKILFFFNHETKEDEHLIQNGEIPSDRLYGVVELKRRGWRIECCDERLTAAEYRLKKWVSWINLASISKALKFDVWVVKDNFSFVLSLLARLSGKRLIYIDSLFRYPQSKLRWISIWLNLRLAKNVGVFSARQAEFWSGKMGVKREIFHVLSYTIDHDFYLKGYAQAAVPNDTSPYILAAGRDIGRDFETLIVATERLGIQLKLVTLPYLLPANISNYSHVQVYQRIPYSELFELYRGAMAVAVPLHPDVEYPSGIRAALEGMLLGKPTLCSDSEILLEYSSQADQEVFYYAASSVNSMVDVIQSIQRMGADELAQRCTRSQKKVIERYSMMQFVYALEGIFGDKSVK